MRKINTVCFIFFLLFFSGLALADDWNLTLKSKVELRNWKLTSKAYKQETFVKGAAIELYDGSNLISKTVSDNDGNFAINIPSTGGYTLLITSSGYNPKKFIVKTNSNAIKAGENFIPTVDMTSFITPKLIKGVGDLGLDQPIINAENNKAPRIVDNNGKERYKGFNFAANMNDAEYRVIQKFCTCNKLGDMAMEDKNYSLAKTYYLMASDIMAAESYPNEKLKKAEEELKHEKATGVKKWTANGKKSKTKVKTNVSTQKIITEPVKSTDFKNSSNTGKPARKIRKTLGE